jgi:hypothetical protein
MKSFLLPYQELTDNGLRSETETGTRVREESDQRRVAMCATESATGARENESAAQDNYNSLPRDQFLLSFQETVRRSENGTREATMTKTSAREESDQRVVSLFATETITEAREQADFTAPIFSAVSKES